MRLNGYTKSHYSYRIGSREKKHNRYNHKPSLELTEPEVTAVSCIQQTGLPPRQAAIQLDKSNSAPSYGGHKMPDMECKMVRGLKTQGRDKTMTVTTNNPKLVAGFRKMLGIHPNGQRTGQ